MHKVGDKFQVVVARDGDEKVCAGDVVTLQRVVNSYGAEFITESGEGFVAEFEDADVGVGRIVRPIRPVRIPSDQPDGNKMDNVEYKGSLGIMSTYPNLSLPY